MPDLTIRVDGEPVQVRVEPNAAETLRQAISAAASAAEALASEATALAAAGPNYADTAAGLAATSEGDAFAVVVAGVVTVYRHDPGPVATALRVLPTSAALALPGAAADLGERDTASVQAKLDVLRAADIDLVEFEDSGEIPGLTGLHRSVSFRDNGSAGTMVPDIDADGFLTTTGGRGGSYLTVEMNGPVVYQKMEFRLGSGASTTPDAQSVLFIPWTANISEGTYAVPPTSMHLAFSRYAYSIGEILTTNGAINIWQTGGYPGGHLSTDTIYTVEAAIVEDTVYIFLDGEPIATATRAVLETLTGDFAGFEIFKDQAGDGNPGIRNLEFSNSPIKARAVRDTYFRSINQSGREGPSDAYLMRDDFTPSSLETGEIGSLGWSFTSFTPFAAAAAANHPGIIRLQTPAATTLSSLYPGNATNITAISLGDVAESHWVFAEDSAGVTDYDIRIGFFDNIANAPPNNGVYLEKLAADTNWFFVTRTSSAETRTDTGVAAGTTDWITYRFFKYSAVLYACGIKVNGGTEVLTDEVSTNIPVANLVLPGVQMQNTGTTSRFLKLDYFSMFVEATTR